MLNLLVQLYGRSIFAIIYISSGYLMVKLELMGFQSVKVQRERFASLWNLGGGI